MRCTTWAVGSVSSPSRGTWIEMVYRYLIFPMPSVVPLTGDVD